MKNYYIYFLFAILTSSAQVLAADDLLASATNGFKNLRTSHDEAKGFLSTIQLLATEGNAKANQMACAKF